jgi:methyl-accepting chemotaxis protein
MKISRLSVAMLLMSGFGLACVLLAATIALGLGEQVRRDTEQIASASASAQIAAGNLDLSARTEQQAASLEETAAAMDIVEMDQGTQQNAALVEEVAAAAQSLNTQSEQLARAVSRFQIDGVQAQPSVASTPPARTGRLALTVSA